MTKHFRVELKEVFDTPVPKLMTRAEVQAFNTGISCAAELASRRGEYYGYESDSLNPQSAAIAQRCTKEFFNLRDEIENLKVKMSTTSA